MEGGAARAAYRLHTSLLKEDIDCQMLVLRKRSEDDTVIGPTSIARKFTAKLQSIINTFPLKHYDCKDEFSASFSPSFQIVEKINKLNPDLVHLHWINAGFLKIEDLKKIKAPIVWSLHDMWAFTGGCHYADTCVSYTANCGNCPVLNSIKENDLSRDIFKRKQKIFFEINNLTIVGLSKWLETCAKSSTLFKNREVVNLPNPIDTSVFKPFAKEEARSLLGLPKKKKLILFGAMSATSNPRKGFIELKSALKKLQTRDIEFLVFGSDQPKDPQEFDFKTHYLGQLNTDISLVKLYSAADVVIVPSLQENLSNVILESLSCGTPVVGFKIGGNSDMIEHKINGYLAEPYETDDLAHGIEWVLNNENSKEISKMARDKVLKNFDSKLVAKKYIELYNKNIEKKTTGSY